jgi:pumilio homology domain family member 6
MPTSKRPTSAGSKTPAAKKPRLVHPTSKKAPSVPLQKRTHRVHCASSSGDSDNSTSEDLEEISVENDEDEKADEGHTLGPLGGEIFSIITCFLTLFRWLLVTKNAHVAQRVLTHQRRASKPHSALLADAKRAWSLAQQKAISKEERATHITSLMGIVRGMIQDIVFKHDASRIVQTIIKWGSLSQRSEVATELQGRFKELVQNKYSKVGC